MARKQARNILVGMVCVALVFAAGLGIGRTVQAASASARHQAPIKAIPYIPSKNALYTRAAQTLSDWPEFGYDASGARDNIAETILSPSNVGQLVPAWTSPDILYGGAPYPMVYNGTFYTQSGGQPIVALNATTGVSQWPVPPYIGSDAVGIAGASGVVYVGDGDIYASDTRADSRGYALNAMSGTVLGQHLYDGPFTSPITVVNGVIYAGVGGNYLSALNASTGNVIWKVATGGPVDTAPAVVNGVVYAGAQDNYLYAVNASSGALMWPPHVVPGGIVGPTLAVVGGLLYVQSGTLPGNLSTDLSIPGFQVYNVTNGLLAWSYPVGGPFAVANGVVYVGGGTSGSGMSALDASTGQLQWFSPNDSVNGPIAVANGVVYFTTSAYSGGSLYAISASSGAQLWSYQASCASGTIVASGILFCQLGQYPGSLITFHLP